MSKLNRLIKAEILRIVIYQFIIIVGFTCFWFLFKDLYSGLSFAMGAMSYWLPTLIFMLRVSAHTGARAATRFMVAFFAGEVIKLTLCGVLFVIAIKYLQLALGSALVGLIVAIIAFWIASILVLFQTRVRL